MCRSWSSLWWRGQSRIRFSSSVRPPRSTATRWWASSSRVAVQPGYWQCPARLCSARCWAYDAQRPTRECTRSRPLGLIVSRRASQPSRSAVSTLSGPAPSSIGGASSLRCTISVVGLRRTPASTPLVGERDERVRGRLLPAEDVPSCLSAARWVVAMFQIACSNASPARAAADRRRRARDARASRSCSTPAARTTPRRPRRRAGRACGRPARSSSAPSRRQPARAPHPSSGVANSAAAAT